MGFEQALSGLTAASQNLDAIGNNIANASTVGYKDVRAEFADVYATSLWGANAAQIGIGTRVAAVAPIFNQGNITTTGNPLDIAINGGGFFQVQSNGITNFSRDGQFSLNSFGQIVNNSGALLLGYPAGANGTISSAPPVPLSLSQAPSPPKATTTASISLNLNAQASAIAATPAFSPSIPATYNSSTSMSVYDSQGTAHTLTVYFANVSTPASPNSWSVYATADGTLLNGGSAVTSLNFNASGSLGTAVTPPTITIPASGGASAMSFLLNFPNASTTQYAAPFSVSSNTQDGFSTGQLAGFSISKNGIITGQYTNGQTVAQGQLALASFTNPQGLIALGGNAFAQTAASGQPVVGAPASGSFGPVQSGALEGSTVDVTTELVNMITAQRVYQANAETVKTQDQVQQTLLNLR
jgi:flagellar hook protein FlgE